MDIVYKLKIEFDLVDSLNKMIITDETMNFSGGFQQLPVYKAGLTLIAPSGVIYNNIDYIVSPDLSNNKRTLHSNRHKTQIIL